MTSMIRHALFAFLAFSVVTTAQAREIDAEKTISTEQIQLGQSLPKTLVVRVKEGTNQAEVLHANSALQANDSLKQLMSTSSFVQLDNKGRMMSELDRDSSSSSWYFCYPNNYYPYYNYCGYNYAYSPYYAYNYGGYNYTYYGWPYSNPYCYGYGSNPPGPAGGPGAGAYPTPYGPR